MNNKLTVHKMLLAQSVLIVLLYHKVEFNFLMWVWIVFSIYFLWKVLLVWAEARKMKELEKIVKVVNLNNPDDIDNSDLPEELKEKMKGFMKSIEDVVPSKRSKCGDPHCKACWGLSDNKTMNDFL